MILIEQSFCWTDLRKVGIIYSFINIILKAGVIVLGAQISGQALMVAGCFGGLYMLLHLILVYGLYSRKPTILMWWLAFAPFQIIILQTILLYLNIVLVSYMIWMSFLLLLGHLGLTIFMFHNVCVVYSVQHRFTNNQDGKNRDLVNTGVVMKPSATLDPQFIPIKV